jgi:hypothetical protein
MQAGADPWEAAGFLGMTVDVLLATYGHHHPDYQSDAAEKITSKRGSAPNTVVRLGEKQTMNRPTPPHSYPTEMAETNENISRRR